MIKRTGECILIAFTAYFMHCKPDISRDQFNSLILTVRMKDSTAQFLQRHEIMTTKQLQKHKNNKNYRGEICLS
jgi:hypothetical protein